MEFNSIEDIRKHFGFVNQEINEIRSELKKMLFEVHPDSSGGDDFKSLKDEREYYEIKDALGFIERMNNSDENGLISVENIHSIVKAAINELAAVSVNQKEQLRDKEMALSVYQKDFSKASNIKHRGLKITSSVVAGIITLIWIFPETIQNHSILKNLYLVRDPMLLSGIWLCALIFTSMIWFILKRRERKSEELIKSYSLESVQNNMFQLFVDWCYPQYLLCVAGAENRTTQFSKDDLIHFLMNDYYSYKHFLNGKVPSYALTNEYLQEPRVKKEKIAVFSFGIIQKIEEIDLEMASHLADLIILRLLERSIIQQSGNKGLSDLYIYTQ